MKIGIISDIHGALTELNAALAILKRENVDLVVCAGDLVDFGPWNDEVVALIGLRRIPCVQGNHDRLAEERQALRRAQIEQGLSVKLLEDNTVAKLLRLPTHLRFEWEGCRVLLTHANPWGSDNDYIVVKSMPAMFHRVINTAQADITILGHTHQPMWINSDKGMILNPGSVSVNYTYLFGTCGVLSLPERDFHLFDVETGHEVPIERRTL